MLAAVGVRTTIGALTLGLQLFFLAFFVRHLAFVVIAVRAGAGDQQAPGPDPDLGRHAPRLSVLVACHNEERVLDRLLAALGALRYPADRLQLILVNDNSADRTGELLDRWAAGDPDRAAGASCCTGRPARPAASPAP